VIKLLNFEMQRSWNKKKSIIGFAYRDENVLDFKNFSLNKTWRTFVIDSWVECKIRHIFFNFFLEYLKDYH